jgi:ArsR family transcriptional regulator, arsenate/arsenite/antimonite-responsive transcriptional repressor
MSRPFSSPDAFRAVSDPIRRKILDLLRRRDLRPSELAQSFAVTQPTLSFHLRVLRQSGLITSERRGKALLYRANRAALRPVFLWIDSQRSA